MKPVDQTMLDPTSGNCFSACVASILEVSLEHVPYFMADENWFAVFAKWLAPHGYYPVMLKLSNADEWETRGLCILGGKTVRGTSHAVVGRGRTICHDPHPSRDGLTEIEDVTLFVPFNPISMMGAL